MLQTVAPRAWRAALAAATLASAALPAPARGVLDTPGFRAVAVAHAPHPVSAIAVAPDGRLFAAVQTTGQTDGTTPGEAQIRVYQSYAANDGAVLDEGTLWATVPGVRATNNGEGLLGLALAPDFAVSKLVYLYLTTTDEDVNQHVRVYRENAAGTGEPLGPVLGSIEPPEGSAARNGGPLAFGADGCLYLGVGDDGSSGRWNAQCLVGTDRFQSSESAALCTEVCLGPALYPERGIEHDGALNHAGKILRLAVEGASPAQGGPAAPFAAQPFVFAAGLRNPAGLGLHPLTGQLWVTERGESQQAEVGVVDAGANLGWPCLEGTLVAGVAGCAIGQAEDVYASHPDWRPPLAVHDGNPVVTGIAAYTGLSYPAEFYGDVFYLLRDSARLYRVDLAPPCFLPDPAGETPLAFHDSTNDGDFTVNLDIDGDGSFENLSFANLVDVAQGPDPLGGEVLYVVGKRGNGLTDHSVVFRLEYATAVTPYEGPRGRVPASCFAESGWEDAFARPSCLPPGGPCPGQPDGTSCDDGDPCNGAETCSGGVCRRGSPAPDGTACSPADPCRAEGVCRRGVCEAGPLLADGTPCPDDDPCNGLETCAGGACQPGPGALPLALRRLKAKRTAGSLALSAVVQPAVALAPETSDDLTVELRDGGGVFFSGALSHPASGPFWRRRKGGVVQYGDRAGSADGITLVRLRPRRGGAVQVDVKGKRLDLSALDEPGVSSRLMVGPQCFTADLAGRCTLDAKKLRCR